MDSNLESIIGRLNTRLSPETIREVLPELDEVVDKLFVNLPKNSNLVDHSILEKMES